jgi:hypothetical protein
VPDLATSVDLADFPGAPFNEQVVRTVCETVRGECGWHIAPVVTETLTVDSRGGQLLLLPTLKIATVTEVRDVTSDTPRVVTGWRVAPSGMLVLAGGWPRGYAAIEVDLTHGYATCPEDLLGVIAERAGRGIRDSTVQQESLGSRSVTFAVGSGAISPVVARYRVTGSP